MILLFYTLGLRDKCHGQLCEMFMKFHIFISIAVDIQGTPCCFWSHSWFGKSKILPELHRVQYNLALGICLTKHSIKCINVILSTECISGFSGITTTPSDHVREFWLSESENSTLNLLSKCQKQKIQRVYKSFFGNLCLWKSAESIACLVG